MSEAPGAADAEAETSRLLAAVPLRPFPTYDSLPYADFLVSRV
jgi:hypothetical protein